MRTYSVARLLVALVGGLTLSTALGIGAASASAYSVRIVLPAHWQANQRVTIELEGVAPAKNGSLILFASKTACARTANAQLNNSAPTNRGLVFGGAVHGRYTYADPTDGLPGTGTVNFCAYLRLVTTGSTLARSGVVANLPR